MQDFWDSRYSEDGYAYGSEPNVFFKEFIDSNPAGRGLFPAEGEGRNSIYAATKGWQVTAIDYSVTAKIKAELLAAKKDVHIDYVLSDLMAYEPPTEAFDCLFLFFVHFPEDFRQILHHNLLEGLKVGGKVVLEAFHKKQLGKESGGPKDISMLYDEETLRSDFDSLKIISMAQLNTVLEEGKYHNGEAEIIRMIAEKT
jgi:hypothetical protein